MTARRKALTAVAAGAMLAGGVSVAHAETITAVGIAQVKVVAPAPLTNAKIVKAVATARNQAIPIAFEAARNQAIRLGAVAGLQPGAITAIEEGQNSPYGFYGYNNTGRFGPGQYCGPVQKVRRAPRVEGRPGRGRVISRTRVVRCYKPTNYIVSFTATFNATPAPPTPLVTP